MNLYIFFNIDGEGLNAVVMATNLFDAKDTIIRSWNGHNAKDLSEYEVCSLSRLEKDPCFFTNYS